MVWIFIAVKNRYLNLSAELKFPTTQNEPKLAETKQCNPKQATAIHKQLFLTISAIRPVLKISFLTEENIFTF